MNIQYSILNLLICSNDLKFSKKPKRRLKINFVFLRQNLLHSCIFTDTKAENNLLHLYVHTLIHIKYLQSDSEKLWKDEKAERKKYSLQEKSVNVQNVLNHWVKKRPKQGNLWNSHGIEKVKGLPWLKIGILFHLPFMYTLSMH